MFSDDTVRAGPSRRGGGPKTQRGGRGEGRGRYSAPRVRRHSAAWAGDGRETCPEGPKARQKKNAKLDGTITVASLLLIGSLGLRKQLGASLKPYFAKLAWF